VAARFFRKIVSSEVLALGSSIGDASTIFAIPFQKAPWR
jgi:hypothetical protein